MKSVSLNIQIATISNAVKSGYVVNNEQDLQFNYDDAMAHLFEQKPEKLQLIDGDASGHLNSGSFHGYMSYELPLYGQGQVDGELNWNQKSKRVEHVAQDADGKCYLVVSYKF
jgi:hypothetical protein